MKILNPPLPPLELFGVYDRGVPNVERIVLRVNQPVSLNQYGIVLGVEGTEDSTIPLSDNFLWLGNFDMHVPSWVFVYTGPGKPAVSQEVHTKEPLQSIYWGRKSVLFANPTIFPALFSFGEIQKGNKSPKTIQSLNNSAGDRSQQKAIADLVAAIMGSATNEPPKLK